MNIPADKDDIAKKNIKTRDPITLILYLVATICFLSTEESYKSYVYEYYFFYSTINSSTFTSFRGFFFSIVSSLMPSDSFTFYKNFL